MTSVVVVDFGTGNLRSVAKALEHVAPSTRVSVSSDPAVIRAAGRVVLPGQGAIGTWMAALREPRLREAVDDVMLSRPVLGICLGLQALYQYSEEDGGTACLGVLRGRVRHFGVARDRSGALLKIPHMGWNTVTQTRPHRLWHAIENDARFYFVHSYYAVGEDPDEIAAETDYGVTFTSAAARGNVFAVQFHPEKSQRSGLTLLSNFLRWDGGA